MDGAKCKHLAASFNDAIIARNAPVVQWIEQGTPKALM